LNTSVLYFILNPFFGFFNAFRNHRQSWAKNAVWLFVIFFGFTMSKPEIVDSSRYVQKLVEMHNLKQNWEVFFGSLYQVDEFGSGSVDLYQPFVTFLIALFTENGDILFATFGIVFGFFYSRNIWFLLEKIKTNNLNRLLWFIIIAFICVVGFWTLGGVRMWTAAHVFFYGCSIYFSKQSKKGLIVASCAILVHYSYILPVGLLFIYIHAKPSNTILFYIFLTSFLISSFNIEFVGKLIESYVPETFETRVSNYTNEDYAESLSEINNSANWYAVNLNKVLLWAITGIYCLFNFYIKNIRQITKLGNKFYGFSLVLLIIANFLSGIPSGGRYLLIAQLFALAAIFIIISRNETPWIKNYNFSILPILFFFIIISIRVAFDTLTIDSVFSNPLFTLFIKTEIPLIDLIK
jgi:hypothetical protein